MGSAVAILGLSVQVVTLLPVLALLAAAYFLNYRANLKIVLPRSHLDTKTVGGKKDQVEKHCSWP